VSTPAASEAGSLTEWLRSRSDEQLAELLRHRPDLALPAPADLAQLASRLSVRNSVQRAVDALDAFTLAVLEALILAARINGAVALAEAAELLDGVDIDAALDVLSSRGLTWGAPQQLHLVITVREALGPYPAGLGRPAATLFARLPDALASGGSIAAALADLDADERDVLARLADGPPIGTVRDRDLASAPQRLVGRGLLAPIDLYTVELPREVGVAVRTSTSLGRRPTAAVGAVQATPPQIATQSRAPADLDRLGTTAVFESLRLVARLGDTWTAQPPAVLRAGGIGVRELRRTARDLGVDEPATALLAEVAAAAGLIATTTGIDPVYAPTPEFDTWLAKLPAARWTELAVAWLAMPRQPSLGNQRGERDRLITVLGPDVDRGSAVQLRGRVLDVLRELAPGTAPVDRDQVLARLAWQAPRRAGTHRDAAQAALAEADVLGLTAAGGLTGYTRTLLAGNRAAAEQALAAALPEPVDHVLVQPDLTVVVPGPPDPTLAAELALVADLESSGGASVYRVTEASVRRALDAGRTAAELATLFRVRSRTPIPQALSYLIDDLARRHGVLRVGSAATYLRCADEATLSHVLADRAVAAAGLRRIAPTVVVSAAAPAAVLTVLRGAGYAPAAESPDGMVVTLSAEVLRAPSRGMLRQIQARARVDSTTQAELVRRIRAGDNLTEISRHVQPIVAQVPGVTSATTMALLRQAIRDGRRVLLNTAQPDGTVTRHTILPISLGGGFVRGHDSETARLQSFALHRLTAISVFSDDVHEYGSTTAEDDRA
jgi:hypothetical protein